MADDVNHAADLIRQKLVHENNRPDKAIHFSNLYSRLLSQPVLSQKWAILYFLYRLSASDPEPIPSTRETRPQPPSRQQSSEAPVYNDAFSRNGLSRVPNPEDPEPVRLPPSRERMSLRASTREPSNEPSPEPTTPAQHLDAPSEAQLLRDLPFTLQGLSSTNLIFSESTSLKLPSTLPVPIVSLLHTLAEPSLLYRSLTAFVESSQGGLVGQSLRSAIAVELRAYLGLVATLEAQIRRALTQLQESPGTLGLGKAGVTLKRCVVWTREATMGLRLMSMIV